MKTRSIDLAAPFTSPVAPFVGALVLALLAVIQGA